MGYQWQNCVPYYTGVTKVTSIEQVIRSAALDLMRRNPHMVRTLAVAEAVVRKQAGFVS
jgi:hypothetical protein